MLRILNVVPDSIAAKKCLNPGDRIVSINGHEINDVIDSQFHSADERLSLVVQGPGSNKRKLIIRKEPDEPLGIECNSLLIKRCRNKCIFCFVDQMPAGCRKSLYIKDDDYRASFLYGSYTTLGNLTEDDWHRIDSQRLSPLYISVHATEHALRSSMLRNPHSPDILSQLNRLASIGIRMHTQIVLSPGINDGVHLEKTVSDLIALFPMVSSVAVVPVGLTSHREGLFFLKPYSRNQAYKVVQTTEAIGGQCRRRFGTRIVYASDEFYIKAGVPFHRSSFYEDFPQIENGVGMVSDFLQDVSRIRIPARIRKREITVVSGISFSPILKPVLQRLKDVDGLSLHFVTVPNIFFGPTVTVAGLLTGSDVLRALKNKRLGELLLLPRTMFKEDEEVFLDGTTPKDVEHKLGVPVRAVERFSDVISALRA